MIIGEEMKSSLLLKQYFMMEMFTLAGQKITVQVSKHKSFMKDCVCYRFSNYTIIIRSDGTIIIYQASMLPMNSGQQHQLVIWSLLETTFLSCCFSFGAPKR